MFTCSIGEFNCHFGIQTFTATSSRSELLLFVLLLVFGCLVFELQPEGGCVVFFRL